MTGDPTPENEEISNDFDSKEYNHPDIVSFDIECGVSCGPYVEMSVFAYVITDDELNMKESGEIYIRSRISNKVKRDGIKIDEKKVRKAPPYRESYDRIRNILTRSNTVYLAHSAESDLSFLINENRIKQCAQFDFKAYDTVGMMKNQGCTKPGLGNITGEMKIDHDAHECLSDAKALIEILRKLAEKEHMGAVDVLQKYGQGVIRDTVRIREIIDYQQLRTRLKKVINNKNPKFNDMKGTTVCFSETFERMNLETVCSISEVLVEHGGKLTFKASECNVFIHDNNAWSKRLVAVYVANNPDIRVLSVTQFLLEHRELYRDVTLDYELYDMNVCDEEERRAVISEIKELKRNLETKIECHDHYLELFRQ